MLNIYPVAKDCYTPLAAAAKNGHIEIVAMLLQAEGIDAIQGV